ncbi:MAG: 50S ribosomal protein L25 [Patescibacteria group bacterium]|jgi:large subunit ribosomal protein L25
MAKTNPQLKAQNREILGRKVKQLRAEGWTPASIYGKGIEPVSIKINSMELDNLFEEAGESSLIDLIVDKDSYPILFKNPQYHPVDGSLIHIDCYKVNLREKIVATVPIELAGESPAVKEGMILVEITNEVEVEALPANLPEKIEVDISSLVGVDDAITVADLKVDDKVEVQNAADQVIVKIEEPKMEEEIEEPEVAPGEVPATEQKVPEEEGGDDNKPEAQESSKEE